MSVRNWSWRISVHPGAKSSSCAHLPPPLKVCGETATLITPLYNVSFLSSIFQIQPACVCCAVCHQCRALLQCLSSNRMQFVAWKTNNSCAHTAHTHMHMHTLPHYLNPGAECQRAGGMWPGDLGLQTSTWRPDTRMVSIGRGGQNSSGVQ